MNTQTPTLGRRLAALIAVSCWSGAALAQNVIPPTSSTQPEDPVIELSPFSVTSEKDVGYGSAYSTGGTRMNVKFTESPIPVISVNRQLLDDIAVSDAYDVLQYIGGTNKMHSPQEQNFALRGASSASPVIDGLAYPSSGFGQTNIREYEFFDRIEVIKGPAGTLYGSHSVGGLVNMVSKKPLPVRQTRFSATYETDGPDGLYRGTVDTTGPLGDSGRLRYRLVGIYQDGTFWNGGVRDRKGLYGIVTYQIDNTMSVWARASSLFTNEIGIDGAWFMDKEGNVSTFLGSRYNVTQNNDDQVFKHQLWSNDFEIGLEKRLDTGRIQWASRVLARYTALDYSRYASAVNGNLSFYDAQGNLLGTNFGAVADQIVLTDSRIARITRTNPSFNDTLGEEAAWGVYADTLAKFDVGPTRNDMLIYLQSLGGFSENIVRRRVWRFAETGTRVASVWPVAAGPSLIDFTTLDLAGYPPLYAGSPWGGFSTANETTRDSFAFGAQESMKLFKERVILMGGARYDWARSTTANFLAGGVVGPAPTNNHWTTTYGVVVKPFKDREVSLFYNAGQTFAPTGGGVDSLGQVIPNRETKGSEGGIKGELLNGRLITTASVFEYDTSPYLQTINIINPDGTFQSGTALGGKQTIKGWEIDTAFTVLGNLSVIAGIGETESKLQDGTIANNTPLGVQYRGFAKYDFRSGPVSGLSLGLGYSYVADRYVDATNTLKMQDYYTVQLLASYRLNRHWQMQLNVYNLFDEAYSASAAANRAFITPGRSREFGITFRYDL